MQLDGITYISLEKLCDAGVPYATAMRGMQRYDKGAISWKWMLHPYSKRNRLIQYSSIPERTIEHYGLMPQAEYALQSQELTKPFSYDISDVEQDVAFAYEEAWKDFVAYYDKYDATTKKELAQSAALAHVGIKIRARKKYMPLLAKYVQCLESYELKYLKITSTDYARKRLKIEDSIESAVELVGVKNEGNQNSSKWTQRDQAHMELIYARSATMNIRRTWEYLTWIYANIYELPSNRIPSEAAVYYHLSDPKIDAAWAPVKYGSARAYKRYTTPAQRLMALHPCDCWMMDGTRLMLWYEKNGKPSQLNVYIIVDVFTGMIVGYSVDETESRLSIAKALYMAIDLHGVLPYELMHDNASGHKTSNIKKLRENTERLGMTWTASPVGKPQYKAQVERMFGTLQTRWFSQLYNYAGEGIISTRKLARPNPEHLDRLFAKKGARLPTREQCEIMFGEMVALHNLSERKNGLSPSELFKLQRPLAIELDAKKRTNLIIKPREITVRKACLQVISGKETYQYILGEGMSPVEAARLSRELEGKTLNVYFDPAATNHVDVYTLNDRFICSASQSQHVLGGKAVKDFLQQDNDGLVTHMQHVNALKTVDEEHRTASAELVGDALDDIYDENLWRRVHKDKLNDAETKAMLDSHRRASMPILESENMRALPQKKEAGTIIDVDKLAAYYKKFEIDSIDE